MPLREECEKAFADLFKIVDRDNSGEISLFEYLVAQKKIHSMTLPKKRWMFKDMDKDEDGKISAREWHEAMRAIADDARARGPLRRAKSSSPQLSVGKKPLLGAKSGKAANSTAWRLWRRGSV